MGITCIDYIIDLSGKDLEIFVKIESSFMILYVTEHFFCSFLLLDFSRNNIENIIG